MSYGRAGEGRVTRSIRGNIALLIRMMGWLPASPVLPAAASAANLCSVEGSFCQMNIDDIQIRRAQLLGGVVSQRDHKVSLRRCEDQTGVLVRVKRDWNDDGAVDLVYRCG
jgi:hypothetical protein